MKKMTLRAQLTTVTGCIGAVMLTTAGWAAYAERTAMLEGRVAELQNIVDIGQHSIARQQQAVAAGLKTLEEAQKSAKGEINTMRYGSDGYVGVVSAHDDVVVHPNAKLIGQNMDSFRDADGVAVFSDIATKPQQSGTALIRYRFPRPGRADPSQKITFARYDPQWQWSIFSGVYVDDIDSAFRTRLMWDLLVFGGLTATLMLALRRFLSTTIVDPIENAVQACERIASGDLATTVSGDGEGEIGRLLRALQTMRIQLSATVGTVRQTSSVIAVAAREVAAGSTHLSGRTEQQAAALEETAATMEELTSAVKQNASNSHEASQVAQTASQTARQGGQVVGQVVATMQEISAGSRRIEEITGVIDGIAFQTNILALNAAVEAARAGETGRGFAVVAGEVRVLAQRSATAAKEIKALIGESVKQVSDGADLAVRAGQAMDDVVESVTRVSGIIHEISRASAEQSDGIEQVHQTVSHMDESTQQNAALVEQSAAAAGALSEQADRLIEVVAAFRIDMADHAEAHVGPGAPSVISEPTATSKAGRRRPKISLPAAV